MSENHFELQTKFIKLCGILHSPIKGYQICIKILQSLNVIVIIYCIFTLITFIYENYTELLEISECMATIVTAIIGFTKLLFLFCKSDEILGLISDIRTLNRRCE